jgi:hypothetical protein
LTKISQGLKLKPHFLKLIKENLIMTERSKTALTTEAYKNRRVAAGLRHPKIWCHPDDAPKVREFAASLALTAAALESARVRPVKGAEDVAGSGTAKMPKGWKPE